MRLLLAASVLLGFVATHDTARACGGLFCNGTFPSSGPIRIVQDGERVLFAQTATGVTMIIEVRYDGQPTSFAWLLPIPGLPAGMDLDDALGVSVPEVFTTLQSATEPTFTVVSGGSLGSCGSDDGGGCFSDDVQFAPQRSPTIGGSASESPYVTISETARVGAYDATHLEATDAGALYGWLGDNGYFQDPAARPLLKDYIDKGWSFIALKLQNGASNGDIRPIVLHLGEAAPCVPLRLTRIAANDDMPIFVWVIGPGRAIPKNFVHAVVNDETVSFPNGPDYFDRLADAVDLASGHAWVTEFAAPASNVVDGFDFFETSFQHADTPAGMLFALGPLVGPTASRIIREEVVKPDDVSQAAWDALDVTVTTIPEDAQTVHGVDVLHERLQAELVRPMNDVRALLTSQATLTRLVTVQDAAEMTKDPIFGFNATLPMVSPTHTVVVKSGSDDQCRPRFEATYASGRKAKPDPNVVATSGLVALTDASPLLRVEVLDEEGDARPFDPAQAADVDRALDGAILGIPSIPSDFELRPAKRTSHDEAEGCKASLPGAFVVLPLLYLFMRARRAKA